MDISQAELPQATSALKPTTLHPTSEEIVAGLTLLFEIIIQLGASIEGSKTKAAQSPKRSHVAKQPSVVVVEAEESNA